jgi:rubrerythrin
MATNADENLAALGTDKALAIATYGETVAACRYQLLSDKAPDAAARTAFAEMADEEQEHKRRLQVITQRLFPGTNDFYLKDDDMALVVDGPRLLDVRDDHASFAAAMKLILVTEKRTAGFYAKMSKHIDDDELHALFVELAEEGAEHYKQLQQIARRLGADPSSKS